jgi:hypothetical protein
VSGKGERTDTADGDKDAGLGDDGWEELRGDADEHGDDALREEGRCDVDWASVVFSSVMA